MRKSYLAYLTVTMLILLAFVPTFMFAHAQGHVAAAGPGVGNIPQGTQSNSAYANSFTAHSVTNVDATTQKTSCYTPEVPYFVNDGPNDGYSGESACNGAANTGENLGPYPTQAGSNPGYPAPTPMLVKDHSESDIRVDPTNANHLIGSSKWFVSPTSSGSPRTRIRPVRSTTASTRCGSSSPAHSPLSRSCHMRRHCPMARIATGRLPSGCRRSRLPRPAPPTCCPMSRLMGRS